MSSKRLRSDINRSGSLKGLTPFGYLHDIPPTVSPPDIHSPVGTCSLLSVLDVYPRNSLARAMDSSCLQGEWPLTLAVRPMTSGP